MESSSSPWPRNDAVALIARALEGLGYLRTVNDNGTVFTFKREATDSRSFHVVVLQDSPYLPFKYVIASALEQGVDLGNLRAVASDTKAAQTDEGDETRR